jgi:hypothetical protein
MVRDQPTDKFNGARMFGVPFPAFRVIHYA